MVEIKNITKYYGEKLALDDISFSLDKGDILGFLGPNGAGKSTTMNIITGYISADKGTVTIDGCEISDDPKLAKSKIGYLPEQPPLYQDMTVKDYLRFVFDLKKVKLNRDEHIKEICDLVLISDVYNRLIKNLSKGYKQRVGLAQALIGYPEVLILDEPTVGLDPNQIIEIRSLIKKLQSKHSIIISSHVLSEIQAVCNRVVVINNGKIIADDKTANLSQSTNKISKYNLSTKGDRDKILKTIESIEGVQGVKCIGNEEDDAIVFEIECDSKVDIRQDVFHKLMEMDIALLSFNKIDASLEDVFVDLTSENIETLFDDSKNDEQISENDSDNTDTENQYEEDGGKR